MHPFQFVTEKYIKPVDFVFALNALAEESPTQTKELKKNQDPYSRTDEVVELSAF
jgi:hypothetical protein